MKLSLTENHIKLVYLDKGNELKKVNMIMDVEDFQARKMMCFVMRKLPDQ